MLLKRVAQCKGVVYERDTNVARTMNVPAFAWSTLLPPEPEVDPQLYDDLVSIWCQALVEASLVPECELVASASALFRRVASRSSDAGGNSRRPAPACAPQILSALVSKGKCFFMPRTWPEDVLRTALAGGPLFEPPVQLGEAPANALNARQPAPGRFSGVPRLWRRLRTRKQDALVQAFPTASIEPEQMLSETYRIVMVDALASRCKDVCARLEEDRERNPRGLYILDEFCDRFCGRFVEDALAVLIALSVQGSGRLCAVRYATDPPVIGFQYRARSISETDRSILALDAVRSKLAKRSNAWKRVAVESEAQARDILAGFRGRLTANAIGDGAAGHVIVTRSLAHARERAAPHVRRKLLAEHRIRQLQAAIEQLERTIWAMEQAQDNANVSRALGHGVRHVKSIQERDTSVDTLSGTLDDLAEVLETNADFTQAILDEAQLEGLDGDNDDELDKQLAHLLDASGETRVSEQKQLKEAGARSLSMRCAAREAPAGADARPPLGKMRSTGPESPRRELRPTMTEDEQVEDLEGTLRSVDLSQ